MMLLKPLSVIIAAGVIAGCSARPDAPPPPVSMANPASVYCAETGGKTEIVNTEKGQVGYCLFPDGQRIEEWTLYRRDHPQT